MSESSPLLTYPSSHDFLLAIDSDGCVLDSMEIKHKECFIPQFIKHYKLQRVAKFARETFEFVNLYSKHRGANRFVAVKETLELLRQRPELAERGLSLPAFADFYHWMDTAANLGNPDLEAALKSAPSDDLKQALAYSNGVNAAVADIVEGVPPFPALRETLEKASAKADAIVVSQTPCEALEREWAEHNIAAFVNVIAGQEMGSKAHSLRTVANARYKPGRILMIGDAIGDLKAAKAAGTLFFPILPGDENRSWERLRDEGLDRFFAETYVGDYEAGLIREFDAVLPEYPDWRTI